MSIERTDGGTVITGEHIHMARAVTIAQGLALEVNTGLKVSRGRSTMTLANEVCGTLDTSGLSRTLGVKVPSLGLKRTKRGALGDLVTWLIIVWGWEPTGTVTRAVGEAETARLVKRAGKIRAAAVAAG